MRNRTVKKKHSWKRVATASLLAFVLAISPLYGLSPSLAAEGAGPTAEETGKEAASTEAATPLEASAPPAYAPEAEVSEGTRKEASSAPPIDQVPGNQAGSEEANRNRIADHVELDKAAGEYELKVADASDLSSVQIGNKQLLPFLSTDYSGNHEDIEWGIKDETTVVFAADVVEALEICDHRLRLVFTDGTQEEATLTVIDSALAEEIAEGTQPDASPRNEGDGSDDANTDGSGIEAIEGSDDTAGIEAPQGAADSQASLVDEAEDAGETLTQAVISGVAGLFGLPAPLGATDAFSSIDTVASPESFQTFDDPKTGYAIPELTLTIQVQPTATYVEGGRIEVPLDYNPEKLGLTAFTYGTDGTNGVGTGNTPDFFTLDETALQAEIAKTDSIIKGYSIEDDGTLELDLKSASEYNGPITGVKSIQLKFGFNHDYKGKIPSGTVMWKPEPKVFVDAELAKSAVAKQVKTSATNKSTTSFSRLLPTNGDYYGGSLSVRMYHGNNYYYQSILDPYYENRIWVEVPTGIVTSSSLLQGYGTVIENFEDSGYDRYYKKVDDFSTGWNNKHYAGDLASLYNQRDVLMVISDTEVQPNETFKFRIGVDFLRANGSYESATSEVSYTKRVKKDWDFYLEPGHRTGGTPAAICGISDNASLQTALYGPYITYAHSRSSKNTGIQPITGVAFELYQGSLSDAPEKVNFKSITLHAFRDAADPDHIPAWTEYRYEFDIVDTSDGSTKPVPGGSFAPTDSTASAKSISLSLPNLKATEYIDIVRIIPMGTDGESEGELSSLNGFGVAYVAKAWEGRTWPDGTEVPDTCTRVPMAWKMVYDDNPAKPAAYPPEGGTPKEYQGNTAYVYYSSQPYARANLISTEAAAGVNPGTTVDYTLYGYNDSNYTVSAWKNPQVIVRVPEVMSLVDAGGEKTLTDASSTSTHSVASKLIGTANGYSYYSFSVAGYSAPERAGQTAVFSIPLQFAVSSSAAPQTYEAPRVLTTTTDPATFWGSYTLAINGDLGEDRSLYGLAEEDNYHISTSPASSQLKVLSLPRLDASSAVSSNATAGLYVGTELVPAEHDEVTKMKLTIENNGNVAYTSIRLYDILPYSGDSLESTGTVSFVGLTATGATMYFTEATGYPLYGNHGSMAVGPNGAENLQESTFFRGPNWTQGDPTTEAKAFFLDFEDEVLQPGESIEVEMQFQIPSSGDQTAYNQFRYSAQEVGSTAAPLKQTSSKQGFSTATIAIIYHDNLPSLYAEGGALEGQSDLTGKPAPSTSSFTAAGQTLTVGTETPLLTGFTFTGWADSAGSTTMAYEGGENITFTTAGTVNLYPIWERNSYTVSYGYTNTVTGAPVLPTTATKYFNDQVELASAPTLSKYAFSGWTSTSEGVSVENSKFLMPDNEVVFVGSWTQTASDYTIKYYFDGDLDAGRTAAGTAELGAAILQSQPSASESHDGKTYALDHIVGADKTVQPNSADNVVEVHYGLDAVGTDPSDPGSSDGVPDKYQVQVTFIAENGTVTLGNQGPAANVRTHVTLFGPDGTTWSETGTGQLAADQIPTTAASTGYVAGSSLWTAAPVTVATPPTEGTVISAATEFTATYEKGSYGYTIEYYVDGLRDDTLTETGSALYESQVTGYPDKCPAHYKLKEVQGLPIAIGTDAAANVAKVYYIPDLGNSVQTSYTVNYYRDGTKVTADSYTINGSVWAGKVNPTIAIAGIIDASDTKYTGYTLDTAASSTIPSVGDEVASGTVYNLYYVKAAYQVVFDSKGANEAATLDTLELSVLYQDKIANAPGFPAEPTKEGHVFRGWQMPGGTWLTGATTMPAKKVVLTAVWEQGTVVVVDNNIKIVASSFVMSLAEAQAHQSKNVADMMQELIDRGRAKAWLTETLEEVPISAVHVQPIAPSGNGISANAGDYKVSYRASSSGKTATATVLGTVYDNKQSGSAIAGNNFSWDVANGSLTENQVRSLASITVFDQWGNKTAEKAALAPGDLARLNSEIMAMGYSQNKDVWVTFTSASAKSVSIKAALYRGPAPVTPPAPGPTPTPDPTPAPTPTPTPTPTPPPTTTEPETPEPEAPEPEKRETPSPARVTPPSQRSSETTSGPTNTPAAEEPVNPLQNVAETLMGANDVPLGSWDTSDYWSLASFLLAIAGAVMAVVHAVMGIRRKKTKGENGVSQVAAGAEMPRYISTLDAKKVDTGKKDEEGSAPRNMSIMRIVAIALGIAGIVVLLLVEDFALDSAWFNQWTIIFAVLFVAEILMTIVHVVLGRNKQGTTRFSQGGLGARESASSPVADNQ